MKRQVLCLLLAAGMSICWGGAAAADPILDVVLTAGDCYTITAKDSADAYVQYWQAKVDVQSGAIYSFKDLTDDGDGQGDHTSYMGTDGYTRQCSLLEFSGRGGRVLTRKLSVTGLADRLTFTTAGDNSSFTITYTETTSSSGFYHGVYTNGSTGIEAGDLLTTITVVIRPPTTSGTAWDWSQSYHNVSGHYVTCKVWAVDKARSNLLGTIVETLDNETTKEDGAWNSSNPKSFARRIMGDNSSLGLTEGRTFVLDVQAGLAGFTNGGAASTTAWAGFDAMEYSAAFSYVDEYLADDATRTISGQLLIDIVEVPTNDAPVAEAGSDQEVPDTDDSGAQAVTLDGSASSDSDGTIISYVWTENSTPIATGQTAEVSLAVGTHVITLTVTDDDGATASDTVTVEVTRPTGLGVLAVDLTEGDCYTITAREKYYETIRYWQCKVDVVSGAIYSFKDLTDAGTSAGHSDYLGDGAYGRQCSLLEFSGRGGYAMTRYASLTGLADRLTFTTAGDNSSFTITYTEDASSTDFYHDSYSDGSLSLTPGDMFTTITVVIRPPTSAGTAWDWSLSYYNASAHALSKKIWALDHVRTNLLDDVVKTRDSDATRVDGEWNESTPVSFSRYTVGTNTSLGLAEGRLFILDYQQGLSGYDQGGSIAASAWAGYDYTTYSSAFSYSTGDLAAGATRVNAGKFMINIIADGVLHNQAPFADAGDDIADTDYDGDGYVTVTLDGTGSTDADGTIVSYVWKEGENVLASGATATASLAVGSHTITLVVTDDGASTGSDTMLVELSAGPPVAAAGSDQDVLNSSGDGTETISLDGSGSYAREGSITSWVWTENGTQIATGQTASVTMGPGIHTVVLVVTDSQGDTGSDTVVIEVYWPNWARALSNWQAGISVSLSGVGGQDYVVEKMYHDDHLAEQVIYLKSTVDISLAHNERNSIATDSAQDPPDPYEPLPHVLGINGPDEVADSGDEGTIYFKIDRDLQASSVGYSQVYGSMPSYMWAYSEPFRFATMMYDGTTPTNGTLAVLGQTGDNGGAWGTMPRTTTARFAYGQADAYGNEWHTLAYWDDDYTVLTNAYYAESTVMRVGASDGHCVAVCVNPLTPVISLKAPEDEEFYTTPVKTYHVPKIWDQTSYVTAGVLVNFINLTNASSVEYRIDGGTWQTYGGTPVRADTLFSTTNTSILLEARCGSTGAVLKRTFIMDPAYPGASESHGNLLWADAAQLNELAYKVHNTEPFVTSYETALTDLIQGYTDVPTDVRGSWRRCANQASLAFRNAFVVAVEGLSNAETEAALAKSRLLAQARYQPVGAEVACFYPTPASDFMNELGQHMQQFLDAGVAYDILAAHYRSNQHADGMTPIEEVYIRDGLAKIAKTLLQFRNNFYAWHGGGNSHWAMGYEFAFGGIALAMPTYKTEYFGVSGGDFTTVNDLYDSSGKYWNPFPDQDVTWYQCATDASISTPGHPNVTYPLRPEYMLSDDGYWVAANYMEGNGDRYFTGPLGERLVGLAQLGLANAECQVEIREYYLGYESSFVKHIYVWELMRRLRGDTGTATCVNNYLRRRTTAGVIAAVWDSETSTYTVAAPRAESAIYGLNDNFEFGSEPSAVSLIGTWLDEVNRYYGIGTPLDATAYARIELERKNLWDPYALALCWDPNDLSAHGTQPNHTPVLRPLVKYIVEPGNSFQKPIVATDSDGDTVTLTVENLPTGATFNSTTNQILWTPGSGDLGVYAVVVTADDGVAEVSRPFVIIVKEDAGAGPVPSAPTNVTAEVNQEGTVDIEWTAPSGVSVAVYCIYREGMPIAVVPGTVTALTDEEMIIPGSHTRYAVSAISSVGGESGGTDAAPNDLYIPLP